MEAHGFELPMTTCEHYDLSNSLATHKQLLIIKSTLHPKKEVGAEEGGQNLTKSNDGFLATLHTLNSST